MLIEMAVLSAMVICYFLLVKKVKEERKDKIIDNSSFCLPVLQFEDYLSPTYINERIYIVCEHKTCHYKYECANHETAGEFRSDSGMSPHIVNEDNLVSCLQNNTNNNGEVILEFQHTPVSVNCEIKSVRFGE